MLLKERVFVANILSL